MCKNVFWHCTFCSRVIHASTIPHHCHYALTTGYECLPQEQEQWPIPLYSQCSTCKEERKPRRRRTRQTKRKVSVPAPAPEPAAIEDTTANIPAYDAKESYVWNWIPTPTSACFAVEPLPPGEEWHFPDCELYDGSEGQVLEVATTTMSNGGDEEVAGSSSVGSVSFQSQRQSQRSTHFRSSIPVPVHRVPQSRVSRVAGRMRSNIPVPSSSIRGQSSSASGGNSGSATSGVEVGIGIGNRIAEPEDFDWEYYYNHVIF